MARGSYSEAAAENSRRHDTRGPRRHGKSTRGSLAFISGIEARAFKRKCWPRGRGPRGQSAIETYRGMPACWKLRMSARRLGCWLLIIASGPGLAAHSQRRQNACFSHKINKSSGTNVLRSFIELNSKVTNGSIFIPCDCFWFLSANAQCWVVIELQVIELRN
jgi:hypothetical protein